MENITQLLEVYNEDIHIQSLEERGRRLQMVRNCLIAPIFNEIFDIVVTSKGHTTALLLACDVVTVLGKVKKEEMDNVVGVMQQFITWFISKEKIRHADVDWKNVVYPTHKKFVQMLFKKFKRRLSGPIIEMVQVYVGTGYYAVEIGDYVFSELTKIGQGRSFVYRGICPVFGEQVAIKVIKHPTNNLDRFKKYLKREILILQTSHSSKIVGLNEVLYGEDVTYLVMEMLEGDLRSILRDKNGANRVLPLQEAVHFLRELISVVSYFHVQLDGDHRDIKPGNLLYYHDDDGFIRLKLGDFGMSKIVSQGEEDPSIWLVGTPLYIAPEIITGQGIKDNSDLYSIGVIAYEMIFGEKVSDMTHVHKKIATIKSNVVKSLLMGLYQPYEARYSWEELLMHEFMIGDRKKTQDKRRMVEVCHALQDIAVLMEKKNREIERNIYELEKRSITSPEVSFVSFTLTDGDFSDIRDKEIEASESLRKSYESELEESFAFNQQLLNEQEKLKKRVEEKEQLELHAADLKKKINNLRKFSGVFPQLPDLRTFTDQAHIDVITHCNSIHEVLESSQEVNKDTVNQIMLEIYHILEIHNVLEYTEAVEILMKDIIETCFLVYRLPAVYSIILLKDEDVNVAGRILASLKKDIHSDISVYFNRFKIALFGQTK